MAVRARSNRDGTNGSRFRPHRPGRANDIGHKPADRPATRVGRYKAGAQGHCSTGTSGRLSRRWKGVGDEGAVAHVPYAGSPRGRPAVAEPAEGQGRMTMAAVQPESPVTEGIRTLEVRWIFSGELETALVVWFEQFTGGTESREDERAGGSTQGKILLATVKG